MKRSISSALHIAAVMVMLFAILTFPGCKKPIEEPSKRDVTKAMLMSGTWKIQSVTVDGVDKTSVYHDLTLSFTASGFTSTHGGPVWPATGTWTFTSDEATAIKRGDNVEVQILDITASALQLGLAWNKTTFGRVSSVSGQHVFTFGK